MTPVAARPHVLRLPPLLLAAALVVGPPWAGAAHPVIPDGAGPEPAEQRARAVLAHWDEQRAAAWRSGDRPGLAGLYVDGSGAGRRDLRMLDDWLDRGLRVRGMATHVLALHVVAERPRRLRLRVTDRLVGAVAVGGGVRRVLPEDRPTARSLVLRRSGGAWRVESVRLRGW